MEEEQKIRPDAPIEKNHMKIPWKDYADEEDLPLSAASLLEKASVIGRVGLMMLSSGTGAWRVRQSMNRLCRELGTSCTVDIGLMTIEFNCFDGDSSVSQALSIPNTGVNTSKLFQMEKFVENFPKEKDLPYRKIHEKLDQIEKTHGLYSPAGLGLASALACAGFTFLLGGGPIEMVLAFIGAGIGNAVRAALTRRHFTLFMNVAVSVALACLAYAVGLRLLRAFFPIDPAHEAGYICAMLFIIPGFPFITSGIDLAKLDLRSGLERLSYAVIIVMVATLSAWIMALVLKLTPVDFLPLGLSPLPLTVCRIFASFAGVFGFSIMFNSTRKMAATAALIGAIANTLRLSLVDFCRFPAAAAAFTGALCAGLLASFIKKKTGYPRISLTVPSIVIMVPGLYLYRTSYHLGLMNLDIAGSWLASAIMIIVSLPLGLIAARILTDRTFRYCS